MEKKCCQGRTDIAAAYASVLKYDGKIRDTKAFYFGDPADTNFNEIDTSHLKAFYGHKINDDLLKDFAESIYNNTK